MIASIDYLTLTVAGALLFYVGTDGTDPKGYEIAMTLVGVFLFVVGAGRALMSAFGL